MSTSENSPQPNPDASKDGDLESVAESLAGDGSTPDGGASDANTAEAIDVVHGASDGPDVESLRSQVADLEGQLLRGQAEMENYRKRARRDLEAERKYAALPLLRDLVGVIDNLGRALEAAESASEGAADDLTVGVKMVASEIQRVFETHGCRPAGNVGDTFDPNVHEAIAQQPSDSVPAGAVTLVHQLGYHLHDRVVRPAQVIVSTGPPAATGDEADSGNANSSEENT